MSKSSRFDIRFALCLFCLFWCVVGAVGYLCYTFGPAFVPKPIGQVSYHFGPGGLVSVIAWVSVMLGIIWALSRAFSWSGQIRRLLLYNILALAFYYGLSMCRWPTNDSWIGALGTSWLVGFYVASFLALHKRVSNAAWKSLGATFVAMAAYFLLLALSAPFVDPYF
jgi:hypothetical protein